MGPLAASWDGPPLSTRSADAVHLYRDAIAALVSGSADAAPLLQAAIAVDPCFVLAHIGLAVSRVAAGEPYLPSAIPPGATGRGERQHAEVVSTMLSGDPRHGADLRREHLVEFPGDLLIVWLPALRRVDD